MLDSLKTDIFKVLYENINLHATRQVFVLVNVPNTPSGSGRAHQKGSRIFRRGTVRRQKKKINRT